MDSVLLIRVRLSPGSSLTLSNLHVPCTANDHLLGLAARFLWRCITSLSTRTTQGAAYRTPTFSPTILGSDFSLVDCNTTLSSQHHARGAQKATIKRQWNVAEFTYDVSRLRVASRTWPACRSRAGCGDRCGCNPLAARAGWKNLVRTLHGAYGFGALQGSGIGSGSAVQILKDKKVPMAVFVSVTGTSHLPNTTEPLTEEFIS